MYDYDWLCTYTGEFVSATLFFTSWLLIQRLCTCKHPCSGIGHIYKWKCICAAGTAVLFRVWLFAFSFLWLLPSISRFGRFFLGWFRQPFLMGWTVEPPFSCLNHENHIFWAQKDIMKSYWKCDPKSTCRFLNTKFHRVHRRPWWPCSITPSCHGHISMRKSWWKQMPKQLMSHLITIIGW